MQEDTSFCPSFSCYTSDKLADIAVKVTQEFNNSKNDAVKVHGNDNDNDDDDFEFVSVVSNPDTSSPIRPVFPIFNRNLLSDHNSHHPDDVAAAAPIGIQLKKLFISDRDDDSSSSSSTSSEDELERIEPGTYCVWAPKRSPNRCCEKSKSTGSGSKRWRFRDLLKRSHSDGKDSFVFLNSESEKKSKESTKSHEVNKVKAKAKKRIISPHEAFYVRNKGLKEGDKRKSYLPYRKDLVGLFSSDINSFGRTFHPFS